MMGRKWYIPFITGFVIGLVGVIVGYNITNWQFYLIGAMGLGAYFTGVYRGSPKGGFYE